MFYFWLQQPQSLRPLTASLKKMSVERNNMIDSLNRIFIPELRKLKFTGSFPHFRKIDNDITNLLTFQFDRNGGGFIIELANHKGNEYKTHWGEIITLNKLTAHDLNERIRVYPNWSVTENKQAQKTQNWQTTYFLTIKKDNTSELNLPKKLFTKTNEIE